MSTKKKKDYGITSRGPARRVAVPKLPFEPAALPKSFRPGIGLIGCGGIAAFHLAAYRKAGFRVVALCDADLAKAKARRDEFYPKADVLPDAAAVFAREDVMVVDLATHPGPRLQLIEQAIAAGKHILSQKPFVLDLREGERLVKLADRAGVKLAVNQNGRWAPHYSYMRQAVARGKVGEIAAISFMAHFNHNWTAGTPFDRIHHLLLYDYGIHFFDFAQCCLAGQQARRIFATVTKSGSQQSVPPLLANVVIEYPRTQVTITWVGDSTALLDDQTVIVGDKASLHAGGPDLNEQRMTYHTARGSGRVPLRGSWFTSGFQGTMAELLRAIQTGAEPNNAARHNLAGLQLCFAAVKSADTGRPVDPATVKRIRLQPLV